MAELTPKQEMFCKEYIIDLNATQAAIRAGYSHKTANGYYVYILINPMNDKIFYIGKGKGRRVTRHAKEAINNKGNTLNIKEIKEIVSNGYKVKEMILFNNLSEDEAFEIERNMIISLKHTGINNIQLGVISNNESFLSKINNLLDRVKPYDVWEKSLLKYDIDLINRVFGSLEKGYYSVVNDLKELREITINAG